MVEKNTRSHGEHEETLALLKIRAMGDRSKPAHYRPADEVFADLDDNARVSPGR